MERTQLFDLMGELKLYGMKAAFDEIMATAVKRQHEPQRIVGDLLSAEISEKQARSTKYQLTIAKLPLAKDLTEFEFKGTPINEALVRDLAGGGFIAQQRNVVLAGGTGTGKTHLAIALGIRACLARQRVQFATATQWVARLGEAKRQGGLEAELRRLSFIPLLVVDEVGYIPFDPEAANLMFALVSSRYERASMIVTSNKPFSAWGEIFGDDAVATAMLDRLVHHATILALKGDSYRLRGKDLDAHPGPNPLENG